MRKLTRSELETALARLGPFRRETLARMTDEEIAEAANSVDADFDELAANARKGGGGDGGGVRVRGILQDPPEGGEEPARNARAVGGDPLTAAGASLNTGAPLTGLATLNRREGARTENRCGRGEVDVEVTGILSGPRGKAAADGAHARAENEGRKRAAEAGLRVTPILSGPAGTAAVDED